MNQQSVVGLTVAVLGVALMVAHFASNGALGVWLPLPATILVVIGVLGVAVYHRRSE